jgi:hypothetical protein
MNRSLPPHGMLLDRGLTIEQLEIARDIARADPNPATNRRSLTMALRDIVSEQEAENKTKKCLTRVWLNPPQDAVEMIAWALNASIPRGATPLLHFGALLATFPFVGTVARVVGQYIKTEGAANAQAVRSDVRRTYGDRSSVDVAARKAYTTLRNIGVIHQEKQTLLPVEPSLVLPEELTGWMAHALMLTRSAEAIPFSSMTTAPELLGVRVSSVRPTSYPLVEIHNSARGEPLLTRCSR